LHICTCLSVPQNYSHLPPACSNISFFTYSLGLFREEHPPTTTHDVTTRISHVLFSSLSRGTHTPTNPPREKQRKVSSVFTSHSRKEKGRGFMYYYSYNRFCVGISFTIGIVGSSRVVLVDRHIPFYAFMMDFLKEGLQAGFAYILWEFMCYDMMDFVFTVWLDFFKYIACYRFSRARFRFLLFLDMYALQVLMDWREKLIDGLGLRVFFFSFCSSLGFRLKGLLYLQVFYSLLAAVLLLDGMGAVLVW